MVCGSLDEKICSRFRWRIDFGPDTRVSRLQRSIWQARPVLTHLAVKRRGSFGINREIIRILHPLDIWTELGLAGQVQGQVHPQTGRLGQWVNEMGKWGSAGQSEVISFGEICCGYMSGIEANEAARQRWCRQTRRIDQQRSG